MSIIINLHIVFNNPAAFGTFFIQVDAPFETIRYCGFEWWNNCVQCWFPKWFWMVGQLIQNHVWIFPNGSTANTKPCLDTSKWWINGPSKTILMNLNGSTACYQHCSNCITMCVQNQWVFLKVELLNGFKWSISRRVNLQIVTWSQLVAMFQSLISWLPGFIPINHSAPTRIHMCCRFACFVAHSQPVAAVELMHGLIYDYCSVGRTLNGGKDK